MKLLIQIPCYNEEDNIENVLKCIPQSIKNIDEIKTIVLDDGSSDNTCAIAKKYNVEIINSNHIGLSKIFCLGLEYARKNNFDILVNIDGDNQYKVQDIEKLIKPIIDKKADIIIGTRPISKIKTFSLVKKFLQKFGSYIVKIISKAKVIDATSGFRAFNKKSILKLNIFNDYSYTIESIIQAKSKNLIIENVDIEVNPQIGRKSKLLKNNFHYISKQAKNLIRFFIIYSPTKFFGLIALILFTIGTLLGIRFLYFYINHQGQGHIQSLILCAIILILSFIVSNIAILSDLISINRRLLEDIQEKQRENKNLK